MPIRLTDGGIETSLIFHQGLDLPDFAAFPLLESGAGRASLLSYWGPYLDLAQEHRVGLLVRVNASTMSHAELDASQELDDGDPADLARGCRDLMARLRTLAVLGGCCGTDDRHLRAMATTCLRP